MLGVSLFHLFTFSPLHAQPWLKKAAKSVFTVKTFNADGTLLGSANGFFIGTGGEAVSSYAPFKGAASAVVIDANGKELPVTAILGGDETYDVVKFMVDSKKTTPLTTYQSTLATGTNVWMLPYREAKSCPAGTIRKTEPFRDSYEYLTLALAAPEDCAGSPLMNEAGEVVGAVRHGGTKNTLVLGDVGRLHGTIHEGQPTQYGKLFEGEPTHALGFLPYQVVGPAHRHVLP